MREQQAGPGEARQSQDKQAMRGSAGELQAGLIQRGPRRAAVKQWM